MEKNDKQKYCPDQGFEPTLDHSRTICVNLIKSENEIDERM